MELRPRFTLLLGRACIWMTRGIPAVDGILVKIEAAMVLSYMAKVLSASDIETIRNAAGGAADVAIDLLGSAKSTSTALSTPSGLKRGRRLVIMGSADVPLEISFLANDWEIVGQFMYERNAPAKLDR
jgi:hypothetical protein